MRCDASDQILTRLSDIIDMLTMWPDPRRQVVRVLAEIDAS
jgi:hypothetical protein